MDAGSSPAECTGKKAFTNRTIEKLSAENLKLKKRIDQMYLDKLDGEIDVDFYREHVSKWREEQETIFDRMKRHQNTDQNYIEQVIKLLEVARNARVFFRTHGQDERAQLLQFILHGSPLENDKIIPAFRPPFDIIHAMAADARQIPPFEDIIKQAASYYYRIVPISISTITR